MTSVFTRYRLPEPTFDRRPNLQNLRPGDYRFGSGSAVSARAFVNRALRGTRVLFAAALRFVTAAKLCRIEREFRIRGPNHDWLRIDDDHFTPVERR